MDVASAIAEILKREGVDVLFGYPRNAVLEAAARVDIRTVIVRQERTGLHMADACRRLTQGRRMGVFAMQHGPGAENAYGGVAQACSPTACRCWCCRRATPAAWPTCPYNLQRRALDGATSPSMPSR